MLRERRRHANYKPNRRLDRKSSRGMIYENEELRLRTININAEVERGQSDIRKLRRENEQLKREIWSLRDEYDRINKKMCAQKNCSSCEHINSDSQSEESDVSCGSCQQDDVNDNQHEFLDRCSLTTADDHPSTNKGAATASISHAVSSPLNYQTSNQEIAENYENSQKNLARGSSTSSPTTTLLNRHNCKAPPSIESVSNKLRENLHVNFGHLSILSEENLTASSDGASEDRGEGTAAAAVDGGAIRLETSMDGNYTGYMNPVNVLHSPLHDVQSILPPLSHFENIPYESSTNSSSLDNQSNSATSTTTTGETVMAAGTNEWDFSMMPTTTISASTMTTSTPLATEGNTSSRTPLSVSDTATTTATTTTQTRSPKHFFSPIKPRIQQLPAPHPPQLSQLHLSSIIQQAPLPPPPAPLFFAANPPDLFVANALASPYHRSGAAIASSSAATTTATDANRPGRTSPPPLIPLRSKTATAVKQSSPQSSFYNLTYLTGAGAAVAVGNTGCTSGTMTEFGYDPRSMHDPTAAMQTATSVPILTDYGIGDYATVRIRPGLRTPLTYDRTLPGAMAAISLLPQSLNTSDIDIALSPASLQPPLTGTRVSEVSGATTVPETLTATKGARSSPNRKTSDVSPRSPASARRKIFSNQRDEEAGTGGSITSEKDTSATMAATVKIVKRTASSASEHGHNDSSSGSDTTKRKASRRVSIIFGDRKKSSSTSDRLNEAERDRETEANTQTNKAIASTIGTTLANEMLQKGRSKSPSAGEFVTQSTPNSPHSTSSRRTSVATANSPHHQLHTSASNSSGGTGHHHHHHHGGRKFSQETIGGGGMKSSSSSLTTHKCSRRFSEGTVDAFDSGGHIETTPITGADSSAGGGSRRQLDSFHEHGGGGGTSISERNSNSFASSRESSTSQSTHSQRRKISVSSHNGGKIPWCGCWGNGCL